MSVSNGKISRPVSVKDVYDCLNLEKQNNRYDLGYCCSNNIKNKINGFSDKHPFKYADLTKIGGNTTADIQTPTPVNALPGDSTLVCEPWSDIEMPNGGQSEPFRLADWEGYDHNAGYPIFLTTYDYNWDIGLLPTIPIMDANFCVDDGAGNLTNYTHQSGGVLNNTKIGVNTAVGDALSTRPLYWGFAYKDGNTFMFAYSDNTFNKQEKGNDVDPNRLDFNGFSSIKNMLENLSVGRSVELVPIIAQFSSYGTKTTDEAGNGAMPFKAWCFPSGTKFKITKSETKKFDLVLSGQIYCYRGSNRIGSFWKLGYFAGDGINLDVTVGEVTIEVKCSITNNDSAIDTPVRMNEFTLDMTSFSTGGENNLGVLSCVGIDSGDAYLNNQESITINASSTVDIWCRFNVRADELQKISDMNSGNPYGNVTLHTPCGTVTDIYTTKITGLV